MDIHQKVIIWAAHPATAKELPPMVALSTLEGASQMSYSCVKKV